MLCVVPQSPQSLWGQSEIRDDMTLHGGLFTYFNRYSFDTAFFSFVILDILLVVDISIGQHAASRLCATPQKKGAQIQCLGWGWAGQGIYIPDCPDTVPTSFHLTWRMPIDIYGGCQGVPEGIPGESGRHPWTTSAGSSECKGAAASSPRTPQGNSVVYCCSQQ